MTKIILILLVLIFLFSVCATQKVSQEPPAIAQQKDFNYYLKQGLFLLNKKVYNVAILQFREATYLKPDSERAFNLLGMAHLMKKNYTQAEEHLRMAISLNNTFSEAYCNIGTVYWKKGELNRAEKMYKKGIELSSNATSAYFNLGNLLISKGKIEEGFAYISKGIKLDPEFLENQKFFSANIFGDSMSNPEVFFLYAKLYASLDNLEKTVEYLEKAKKAGFSKWERIEKEDEFNDLRNHPQLKKYTTNK